MNDTHRTGVAFAKCGSFDFRDFSRLGLPCQVRPVGQRDGGVTMPTGISEAEMDKLLAALKDNRHGRGAPFAPRGMTVF